MKTEDLKPDEMQPAQGKPNAGGKAKRVPLTPEQKEKRRQKLLKQREDNQRRMADIDDEDMQGYFEEVGYFITGFLKKRDFSVKQAPFSFEYLGTDAVRLITQYGLNALWEGTWEWPENRSIVKQLKKIAESKINHMIRDWWDEQISVVTTDDMTPGQEAEVEIAVGMMDPEEDEEHWEKEVNKRDLGFKQAKEKLKKKPELLAYVLALEEANSYEYMAGVLGMDSVKDVLKLEKKVLKYLTKH